MATKTNTGLVSYATAQIGLPYWYGCYGQTATTSLLKSKKAAYPSQYTASDFESQIGKRVHDCSGLIKGYLWSETPTSKPVYDASQDLSSKAMYSEATTKGRISSFPSISGLLVFKGTYASSIHHVGVYVGDGYVVEAKGHSYGVVKTKFSTLDWTFWAKHPDISYVTDESETSNTDTITNTVTATKSAQYYAEQFKGKYKVTSDGLNLRNDAGKKTGNQILASFEKGTIVQCWGGYYSTYNDDIWLYVETTKDCTKYTGFMSIAYLEKV